MTCPGLSDHRKLVEIAPTTSGTHAAGTLFTKAEEDAGRMAAGRLRRLMAVAKR